MMINKNVHNVEMIFFQILINIVIHENKIKILIVIQEIFNKIINALFVIINLDQLIMFVLKKNNLLKAVI